MDTSDAETTNKQQDIAGSIFAELNNQHLPNRIPAVTAFSGERRDRKYLFKNEAYQSPVPAYRNTRRALELRFE